jgi:peroxiredoxin family protein
VSAPLASLQTSAPALSQGRLCFVCVSGEWDKLYAAFALGGSALALGSEVDFFLAFFGAGALRAPGEKAPRAGLMERLFQRLLPRSVDDAPLSRFQLGGLGKWVMRRLMKKHGVAALSKLVADVEELGGRVHYCDTSLRLMGLGATQLLPGAGICGATEVFSRARGGQIIIV